MREPAIRHSSADPFAVLRRIGGCPVQSGLPVAPVPASEGLHILPVALGDGSRARLGGSRPSAVAAHGIHLVTASARDHQAAWRLLARSALAAQREPGLTVRFDPPEAAFWLAMAAAPRPSWQLIEPLEPATHPADPPVREPLDASFAPLRTVLGIVVTARGTPVRGARIALTGADREVRTGPDGRFRIVVTAGTAPMQATVAWRAGQSVHGLDDGQAEHRIVIPTPTP